MRTTLILVQAAILSCLAVFGAQGDPADRVHCPLPAAVADHTCEMPR